ncbi:MAG: hypothetical protein CL609_15275 [Anaerolineaceae bacterium]|nr:hypothetical protein [Anaerolineaceae bacterium]
MKLEQEILEIQDQLKKISGSLNLDKKHNKRDPAYLQLTNKLYDISEQLIEISKIKQSTSANADIKKQESELFPKDSQISDHAFPNAIIENTHVQLAYLDKNLTYLFVNEAYIKGCRISEKELIGKNHFHFFPNENNEKKFHNVIQTGKPVFFHAHPFTSSDFSESETLYWDWSLVPTRDKNGTVSGLVLSLVDVPNSERINMQLEEIQDRWDIDLRNIPTGVIIIDEFNKQIKINDTGKEIINRFTKNKIRSDINYPFNSALGSRILSAITTLTQDIKEGDIIKNSLMKFKDNDQVEITLSVHIVLLVNNQTEISGSICTFHDITEMLFLEKKMNKRNFDLSLLHNLSRNVIISLNFDDVINNLISAIKELIHCSGCIVWTVDEQYSDLLVCAGSFISENVNLPKQKISFNENLTGWVAKHGESVLVNNVLEESRLPAHFSKTINFPIHSLIAVPLQHLDKNFGVLEVFNDTFDTFNNQDKVMLEMLANTAVIAIKNAAFYEHVQEVAAIEERAHLARELHDAVSQTLFSTSIIAESLPRLWEKKPELILQGLDQLQILTKSALAEMRTLLLELRPQFLSETNLNELLIQLTESFQNRSNIQIIYKNNRQPKLPKNVQIVLYRIAQEAMQNVLKHSYADKVELILNYSPSKTILQIKDNGRGFQPDQKLAGHLGVEIMRERAKSANIILDIESSPGKGSNITAIWENSSDEVGND